MTSATSGSSCPGRARKLRQLAHGDAQPEILRSYGEWKKTPPIRMETIEIEPPTLDDNTSDLDRLTRELSRQCRIPAVRVPLEAARGLPYAPCRGLESRRHAGDRRIRWRDTPDAPGHLGRSGSAGARYLRPRGRRGHDQVVAYLVRMRTGKVIDSAGAYNAQIACGDDVISRIVTPSAATGSTVFSRWS